VSQVMDGVDVFLVARKWQLAMSKKMKLTKDHKDADREAAGDGCSRWWRVEPQH
jgi:hypothetical protein